MSATWIPSDDALDEVARSVAVPERDAQIVEQDRTSLLAQAVATPQYRRASRAPVIASAAVAVAAAAAVILWLVVRPESPAAPKESITALGAAQLERTGAWPDFVVRLDDGRIDVRVAALSSGERFRVITSDAAVEVRGTQFIVGAEHGKIASVSVGEGRVEVRWAHEAPIFLSAGETWSPTKTARRDEVDLETPAVAPPPPTTTAPARTASASKVRTSPTVVEAKPATTATKLAPVEAPVQPAPLVARPGEADFRAGIASLRSGDASAAVTSFASACKAAAKEALGEDACFWLGAAANRAGQPSIAREALTRFLTAYPSSARAGEASALLGWLLYDAGEIDAAQRRFELAASDRVPKVKASAERGLEAIKRTRGTR